LVAVVVDIQKEAPALEITAVMVDVAVVLDLELGLGNQAVLELLGLQDKVMMEATLLTHQLKKVEVAVELLRQETLTHKDMVVMV
jgi:hypothetical protein